MAILSIDGKLIEPVVTDKPAGSVKGMKFRTFDFSAQVTNFIEGELKDWPANIQDGFYAKIAEAQKLCVLPLKVVASTCVKLGDDEFEALVVAQEFPPEEVR